MRTSHWHSVNMRRPRDNRCTVVENSSNLSDEKSRFVRTNFLYCYRQSGCHPTSARDGELDQFSVSENELKQNLFSPSSPECEHAYKTLAPENIIQLTTYSGVGILSRSHIPLGQRLAAQATVDCVIDNWTKIIGSSLSKFVDASAMRNQSTQALQVLDPNQSLKQLTATTRRRLEHQMQSLTRPTWQQQNLAFIFLKAPYVFRQTQIISCITVVCLTIAFISPCSLLTVD